MCKEAQFSFDQEHGEPLLILLDDERNTAEFREEGVAYLHEKWGLTEITPDQLIGNHDIPNTGSSAHLYPELKAHSFVTLGYYFMLVKNDHATETLVDTIQFTSQSPINVDPYGFMNIPCDLSGFDTRRRLKQPSGSRRELPKRYDHNDLPANTIAQKS